MMPERVSVSEAPGVPTAAALDRITLPARDEVPVATRAPLPPTPVPLSVTASAPIATLLIATVAPLATDTPPAVVPNAAALDATKVPDETVVAPVKVFVPDRVSAPVPCLTKAPVPPIT